MTQVQYLHEQAGEFLFLFLLIMSAFECGLGIVIGFMRYVLPCAIVSQVILSILLSSFLLKRKERFKNPVIVFYWILYLLVALCALFIALFYVIGDSAKEAHPFLFEHVTAIMVSLVGSFWRYTWIWMLLIAGMYVSIPLLLHKKGYLTNKEIQIYSTVLLVLAIILTALSGLTSSFDVCIEPDGKGM